MSSVEIFWLCVGFTAQAIFSARFLIQWIVSERKGQSVVPAAFWHLSLVGSWMLLAYAIYRLDPVIIFGQAFGTAVYMRNIVLLKRSKQATAPRVLHEAEERPAVRPLRKAG